MEPREEVTDLAFNHCTSRVNREGVEQREKEANTEALVPFGAVEPGSFHRDEFRQRRQAGDKFLISREEVFFLAVDLIIMRLLDRITLGSLGSQPEDRKISSSDVPEWGAMLERVSKVFAACARLLDAELAVAGPWAVLEVFKFDDIRK